MKLKSKFSLLFLGATISSIVPFLTISLSNQDTANTNITLNENDKLYYSTLYTGRNNVFDRLKVLDRRQKLINEGGVRSFVPSVGIIDLDTVKLQNGMQIDDSLKFGVHPGSTRFPGGQHATTISSMLGTRSGINPFSNIYTAVFSEDSESHWISMLDYFEQNNVSTINMSLGISFFNSMEILFRIIKVEISDQSYVAEFGGPRFGKFGSAFRSNQEEDAAIRDFISKYWNEKDSYFDFDALKKDVIVDPSFKNNFLSIAREQIKRNISGLLNLNQLYSGRARFIDNELAKRDIKLIVSAGNDQLKYSEILRYFDLFRKEDSSFENLNVSLLAGWVPEELKTSRNIIYVGSININSNLTEQYSVIGTEFQDDYPFVSTYTGFTTFNNVNRNLRNVNPYIRSYNNDRLNQDRSGFTLFHGTSYSSAILAGFISLAEYELGRKLSISEVKSALALTSEHSDATLINPTTFNNVNYEYVTTSKARSRSGYGIPNYERFIKILEENKRIKTLPISTIHAGVRRSLQNNIFKDIKLKPGETLKISVNWDYLPNARFDGIGRTNWNTEANKKSFLNWINRFDIQALDNANKLVRTTAKQKAYSNTRILTFKNYAFEDADVDINLLTQNYITDPTQNLDGRITVSYEVIEPVTRF